MLCFEVRTGDPVVAYLALVDGSSAAAFVPVWSIQYWHTTPKQTEMRAIYRRSRPSVRGRTEIEEE